MSETNSNTKKSNRGLKNRHAFSSSLDKELYKKLQAYSQKSKVPLSKLFDNSVELYLESIGWCTK
jgi:hypothetical protein